MKKIFSTLLPLFLYTIVHAQYPQWGNLKSGPHAVGFKVVEAYDYSRTYRPKKDLDGVATAGNIYKPFQVSIWYPARDVKKTMLYSGYVRWWGRERDFSKVNSDADLKAETVGGFNYYFQGKITEEQIANIMQLMTPAALDARAADGHYPLVINACPSLKTHTIINEFLASHGYIVVSFPLLGQTTTAGDVYWNDQPELHSFLEDIGFAFAQGVNLNNVRGDRLAIIGTAVSTSGVLWAMKNMNVDAVVSLDGEFEPLMTSSPYYNPTRFRIPLLHLGNRQYDPFVKTRALVDALKFSDITNVQFQLDHPDLYGRKVGSLVASADQKRGYELMCMGTLAFLDRYLKDDKEAESRFKDLFPANDPLYSVTRRTALPPIPTADEILALLGKKEYDRINRLLLDAMKSNSQQANWGRLLDRKGYELVRNKMLNEALILFQLNGELFPDDANLLNSLAEAYETNGDVENMKKISWQILDVLNKKEDLTNREKYVKQSAERRLK